MDRWDTDPLVPHILIVSFQVLCGGVQSQNDENVVNVQIFMDPTVLEFMWAPLAEKGDWSTHNKKRSGWEEKVEIEKVKREGQEREAAVCQQPIPSSPAGLCWRHLHGFCWWYNSAYILHSSLPLLQAVFNTAQDTLCQLKRVLNADETKFRLFTNSQKKKREEVIRGITPGRALQMLSSSRGVSAPRWEVNMHVLSN